MNYLHYLTSKIEIVTKNLNKFRWFLFFHSSGKVTAEKNQPVSRNIQFP